MQRLLRTVAIGGALVACSDSVGPKPPSAKSDKVEVVTTMSKTELGVGDTATFGYYVKNITASNLTLTTDGGCQLAPVLDQVEGPRIQDLLELSCSSSTTQVVTVLAAGQKLEYKIVLRGYDKTKSADLQKPGYLLSTGTFDASMLVTANELPQPVRSDWVRFKVK